MSDTPLNSTNEDCGEEATRREERLNNAVLIFAAARRTNNIGAVLEVLEKNSDLRRELLAHLECEAKTLRPSWPPQDLLRALRLLEESDVWRRYEQIGVGGEGTYGIVYKARDRALGRVVAVKVFKPEVSHHEARARFEYEPRVVSQLDHPGIVPVHEVGRCGDGRPYFVMKWVEGDTLKDLLASKDGIERPRLIEVFRQICNAVAFAHARGFLNRDLKPSNVMIGPLGAVYVMDWGLSKASGDLMDAVPKPVHATQLGRILGTPNYMAPEQWRADVSAQDKRTDVFGLGAILCEILTDHPPYWDADDAVTLCRIQAGDLTVAFARLNQVSDTELSSIAKKSISPAPTDRYADAGEVAQAVTAYLEGMQAKLQEQEVERATLEAKVERQVALRKEFRTRVLAWVGLAAALVVGLVLGLVYYHVETTRYANLTSTLNQRTEAIEQHLDQAETALRQNHIFHAEQHLGKAASRIDEGSIAERLRERFSRRMRELDFLKVREEIRRQSANRGEFAASVKHLTFDDGAVRIRYSRAFRALQVQTEDRQSAVRFIITSQIRMQMLAALDHWAMLERPGPMSEILLSIAREASHDQWGRQFRDPTLFNRQANLVRLQHQTQPQDRDPGELDMFALFLVQAQLDPEPLLRRALVLYPQDFWLNIRLALSLEVKADRMVGEDRPLGYLAASGYARAALALNATPLAHEVLGRTLAQADNLDEGILHLRRAVQDEKSMPTARYWLVKALQKQKKWDEAKNVCREGLEQMPSDSALKSLLDEIEKR